MSELGGPAVESALEGAAQEVARQRPPRILWRFLMPGLTPQLFRAAAIEAGILKETREFGDIWLSPVSGASLERLRAACVARVTGGDPVAERMRREGVDPLPELRRPFPAALLARIQAALDRLERQP